MNGYWMKPSFYRCAQGGDLIIGPIQFNWYGGFRIHLTWPVARTFTVR